MISAGLLGRQGGLLAVLGVIACPITSGDTAFRSARLMLAECLHLNQEKPGPRLALTLPLLTTGAILTQLDFDVLWRYFSWSNQTLAMIALWVAASYLLKGGRGRYSSLLAALPAAFMTAVSVTYILMAPEGFRLSAGVAYPLGLAAAAAGFSAHVALLARRRRGE